MDETKFESDRMFKGHVEPAVTEDLSAYKETGPVDQAWNCLEADEQDSDSVPFVDE